MKGISLLSICTATLLLNSLHAQNPPIHVQDAPQSSASHTVTFSCHEDLLHAFHAAAAKASRPVLNSFLHSGIWINEPGKSNKTALHYAAAESNWGTIRWLLKEGADLEALDTQNNTPLLSAAEKGKASNVKDLLDAGANVSHRDRLGRSALDLAISAEEIKTVRALIRAQSPLETPVDAKAFTPLHRAAKKGAVEIAQALIDAGATVNAIAADKKTPLHYAAYSENPEMITLLLDHDADATAKDGDGRTPRDIAELYLSKPEDCLLCTLSALKIRHWEEAILRLRVAELPSDSKENIEVHLGLNNGNKGAHKDEL